MKLKVLGLEGEKLDEKAVEVLKMYGVEKKVPRSLNDIDLGEFGLVVEVRGEIRLNVPKRIVRWRDDDLKNKDFSAYENVLKFSENKVRRLLEEVKNEGP